MRCPCQDSRRAYSILRETDRLGAHFLEQELVCCLLVASQRMSQMKQERQAPASAWRPRMPGPAPEPLQRSSQELNSLTEPTIVAGQHERDRHRLCGSLSADFESLVIGPPVLRASCRRVRRASSSFEESPRALVAIQSLPQL